MRIFTLKSFLASLCILLCVSVSAQYDLIVAQDGSGNYTSVQAAINAAPTGRTTPYVIFIKNGKYKEKINIPNTKPFITIIGESVANVLLTYDDFSGKPMPGGGVFGTSNSASFTVRAADFTAINITFENTTGESPQALAIYVDGDRSAFKNCRFLGGQDTVYAGGNGARQYFRNCYIDGTVDFIFGDARAVFDSCVIYAKTRTAAGSSYITAANTKQTEPYGYVFRDSKIPVNRGGTVYFLGRPWQNDAATAEAAKSYNKTVFLNSYLGSHIRPEGWSTWDAGTDVTKITYAEYRSKRFDGTAADITQRVPWSRQLSDADAAFIYYDNAELFGSWNPCNVTTGFCAYAPMPIAVSNFKGSKASPNSTFTWNLSWAKEAVQFELFRSSTFSGSYTKVGELTSPNDTTYNFQLQDAVPPAGSIYYYYLVASKAGYTSHITDTVAISSAPTITTTNTFSTFYQVAGSPSSPQSYSVTGTDVTDNITITPPANFEVSANGGTTWFTNASPLVLTRTGNTITATTINVRLNAAAVGNYSGDVVHTSAGATTVNKPVTGVTTAAPLITSSVIQYWSLMVNNTDSAAIRSSAVAPSTSTFNRLTVSNGTTNPNILAYSGTYGQAIGASANGDGTWSTAVGGPGGTLNRRVYQQFTVTANAGQTVRLDSILLQTAFLLTNSNTKMAVGYSKSGFTTDSAEVSAGTGPSGSLTLIPDPNNATAPFKKSFGINRQDGGPADLYSLALSDINGVTIAPGETLTIRLYHATGSTGTPRYAFLKNVVVKGEVVAALPLKLLSFKATFNGDVKLTWQTTNEVNTKGFVVERSSDNVNYKAIGNVSAANTAGNNSYSLTDASPLNGINYYRLKMVDFDNAVEYSQVAIVNVSAKNRLSIKSNPVRNSLVISYSKEIAGSPLKIVSAEGKLVLVVKTESGSISKNVDVSNLQAGTYFLQMQDGLEKITKSFLKL